MAIGADTEASAHGEKIGSWENAVSKIGLGRWAKTRDSARAGDHCHFRLGDVGGMDEAPAIVDISDIIKPLDRAPAGMGDRGGHLALLLGHVNVDGRMLGAPLP